MKRRGWYFSKRNACPLFVRETNPADRLRQLEEQRARINAEIQRVRSRESQEERKRDTRRKILAGAMVLDRVARKELAEKLFLRDMDKYLVREYERALFDLPPRPPGEKGDPPA